MSRRGRVVRVLRVLVGVLVAVAVLGGILGAGFARSMGQSYPSTAPATGGGVPSAGTGSSATTGRSPAAPVVAVVLGATGSVAGDVLAPLDVFGRSGFTVYTVAADRRPVALSGGLQVEPGHTFAEVDAGRAPAPDVVVVPAVVDPSGATERSARQWIGARSAAGSRLLVVCAGAQFAAAAGVLDGRRATSHWFTLLTLARAAPEVRWERGVRYVDDGTVTTTAGVSSGIVGALHLVDLLAGRTTAVRVGAEVAYPGWSPGASTAIPQRRLEPADLGYALSVGLPWGRPTVALGLQDGVPESDVAAVVEAWDGSSFAAHVVPVAAGGRVTTRHGVVLLTTPVDRAQQADRLVVPGPAARAAVDPALVAWAGRVQAPLDLPAVDRRPGESVLDPVLRELAAHTDLTTARSAARFLEYPIEPAGPGGSRWPWRPTGLLVLALGVCAAAGLGAARLVRLA